MYEVIYENRLILKNNMKSTVAKDALGPFRILFFKKQASSYIPIKKKLCETQNPYMIFLKSIEII